MGKTLKSLFTVLFLFGLQFAYAAPAPPPSTTGGTGGPGCWPPPCVPIDGGIVFLMVAAGLYGAKKIYDLRKKTETIS
jgi:hypothetical protein